MVKRLIHHGKCTGEFDPVLSGTDYFFFVHKPCMDETGNAIADITAVIVDGLGRVIFNLKCKVCGEEDALKASAKLFSGEQEKEILKRYHISPHLKSRIKRHWWDDTHHL